MILDTGVQRLSPSLAMIALIGLLILPSENAQAANDLSVRLTPGVAIIDDHAQQFSGRGDVVINSGNTLAASSEVISDVVVYYNEAVATSFIVVVDGAAALTSAGAVAPTDAEVVAALPNAAYKWARCGRVKFARDSGSAITLSYIDHTVRPLGVDPAAKTAVVSELDVIGDAEVYQFSHRERFRVTASLIADGDGLTNKPVPPFHGKIGGWRVITETAVTTGAKGTTPNLEIGTTNVTGSDSVAMAGTSARGVVLALGAPTAANTFKPGDTYSIEFASTTPYIEGAFCFEVDFYRLVTI